MFDPQTAIDMIDYVDSITQRRPPLGPELQVAVNLIPAPILGVKVEVI